LLVAAPVGAEGVVTKDASYVLDVASLEVVDANASIRYVPTGSEFTVIDTPADGSIQVKFTLVGNPHVLPAAEQKNVVTTAGQYTISKTTAGTLKAGDVTKLTSSAAVPASPIKSSSMWEDLGFGPGLALLYHRGKDSRVASAQVDGSGIVRATEEHAFDGSILLEAHCFNCDFLPGTFEMSKSKSVSSFVAIQVASNNNQRPDSLAKPHRQPHRCSCHRQLRAQARSVCTRAAACD
jgi:hypothetical protein